MNTYKQTLVIVSEWHLMQHGIVTTMLAASFCLIKWQKATFDWMTNLFSSSVIKRAVMKFTEIMMRLLNLYSHTVKSIRLIWAVLTNHRRLWISILAVNLRNSVNWHKTFHHRNYTCRFWLPNYQWYRHGWHAVNFNMSGLLHISCGTPATNAWYCQH